MEVTWLSRLRIRLKSECQPSRFDFNEEWCVCIARNSVMRGVDEIFGQGERWMFVHTHYSPCSLLLSVSRMGFSKTHSMPAFRHLLQGGLSASVHFIFCLRQAF